MAIPLGPVIYQMYVNNSRVSDIALDAELDQCWGEHDMFIVRIELPRTFTGMSSYPFWPDDAPVTIVWGRRPDNINTWYGYVNHHNVKGNADSGSGALQLTYYLLGTSKPMNTDKTRTWGNVTPTYIARTIAAEYGLRAIVTSINWKLPFEVQSNESDLHFLNRVSDKCGFRFWVSGGTLYFIDPTVVLAGSSNQGVPSYVMDKSFNSIDTIINFNMNEGSNLPGSVKAQRSIYGLDPASGRVFRVKALNGPSSGVEAVLTEWDVGNVSQAQNLVNAWQAKSQFYIQAEAELFGDAIIYPGKVVYLHGLQLPNNAHGYWLVASAEHILMASGTTLATSDKFVTRVHLLKNSPDMVPSISNVTTVKPEFVPCQLVNSQWQSTIAGTFYNGVEKV